MRKHNLSIYIRYGYFGCSIYLSYTVEINLYEVPFTHQHIINPYIQTTMANLCRIFMIISCENLEPIFRNFIEIFGNINLPSFFAHLFRLFQFLYLDRLAI